MKSPNRFLLGFGIAIGVLVVATVVLVMTLGRSSAPPLPENTPEGTVQRFLLAMQDRDYQKAYSYLSLPLQDNRGQKQSYEDWVKSLPPFQGRPGAAWRATLGKTTVTGDNATVEVTIDTFRPGGPFEDPVQTQLVLFQLSKTSGSWLIIVPPYLWWLYY